MCASDDDECRALHGMDLKEDDHVHEWETLQVSCLFHCSAWRFYHLFICFCFASIACFTDLRRSCNCDKGIRRRTICPCFFSVACSGKNWKCVSCACWWSTRNSCVSSGYANWSRKSSRHTGTIPDQSTSLSDAFSGRQVSLTYFLIIIHHRSSLIIFLLHFLFRWRVNRRAVLTDAQYTAAKQLAITTIRRFFPNNSSFPVFVPLQPKLRPIWMNSEMRCRKSLLLRMMM